MELHKAFVDELYRNRKAKVGDIVVSLGIVQITGKAIQNLNDNLGQLEQIFYTVDFLVENNLVKKDGHTTGPSYVPTFDPQNFIVNQGDKFIVNRMHSMPDYLNEYWGVELRVRPIFSKMIKNGYKTDAELKEKRHFWLPIAVAILGSFLTALLTPYFSNNICP